MKIRESTKLNNRCSKAFRLFVTFIHFLESLNFALVNVNSFLCVSDQLFLHEGISKHSLHVP